jgi:DNA-binding LacI/PurR family transcriptional regulator
MIKLKDVAKRAHVSEATASLVLNRKKGVSAQTRERVTSAAQALGYTPNSIARGLATRRTRSIGLVVTDIENPFFGSVTRFVDEFILARGYTLILSVSNDDLELEEKIISYFIGKRVEGVIIVPTISRRERISHFRDLERHKIPYIFTTTYYPGIECDCVMTDLKKGSYQLARYLIGLGHRDVLFLASHDRNVPVSSLRIEGIHKAFAEAGLPAGAVRVAECEKANFACGYATTRSALQAWTPHAIIGINDIVALGAERAVREKGLAIPEDVSVCGYDDVIFSRISEIPLTTVKQDIKQMCKKTVDVLFAKIKDGKAETAVGSGFVKRVQRIQPELILRESTGPCRNGTKERERGSHEKV